jgi:hypothetical protein
MTKAIFIRTADGLRPASDEAARILFRYSPGDEVLVEHKVGRSAKNHRRAFAFFNLTFDWQDTYDDPTIWRKVCEIAAGHCDIVIDKHGDTHYWPKSISWDAIDDEQEFRELFDRVVRAYLARWGAGLNAAQLNMIANF